jgi:hypothetical protein
MAHQQLTNSKAQTANIPSSTCPIFYCLLSLCFKKERNLQLFVFSLTRTAGVLPTCIKEDKSHKVLLHMDSRSWTKRKKTELAN